MTPPLAGRRVLLLGAETDVGRACAEALADAGATLALVSATGDAEAAFAVKRLASRLDAATSQAIDATNEAAVRVMVRQVSKALGGLNAVVVDLTAADESFSVRRGPMWESVRRHGGRELDKTGSGVIVPIMKGWPGEPIPQYAVGDVAGTEFDINWRLASVGTCDWSPQKIAAEVVRAVAGEAP